MGAHPRPTPPTDPTTPSPAGSRLAATRARRKRTLLLASATGLALVVVGTATATVIATGADPHNATNTTLIPQADPDPLTAQPTPRPDDDARRLAQEAVAAATQNHSTQASDIPQPQQSPDPEPDTTHEPDTTPEDTGQSGTCQASYYGTDFAGRTTANGETFDPSAMTAAHKTLPFNTQVQVTNPTNGKSVTVRINDRGPYIDGRCLDLSTAAFDQIIGTGAGVGDVQWQVVG